MLERTDYLFTSLKSRDGDNIFASFSHKVYFRRLYDILLLCIGRGDSGRVMHAWSILLRCEEFDQFAIWRLGLFMIFNASLQISSDCYKGIDFMRKLMPQLLDEVYFCFFVHKATHLS